MRLPSFEELKTNVKNLLRYGSFSNPNNIPNYTAAERQIPKQVTVEEALEIIRRNSKVNDLRDLGKMVVGVNVTMLTGQITAVNFGENDMEINGITYSYTK